MADEYGPTFITVTDEDGREIVLEFVDALEYNGQQYQAFFPAETEVSRQQLMSVGTKSLLQSLAAFVPGLQIVKNNEMGSDPNTRPEILIRGRSSFEGSSNVPTFIVDGAEVDLDYVFDMDMNDVETSYVVPAMAFPTASSSCISATMESIPSGTGLLPLFNVESHV